MENILVDILVCPKWHFNNIKRFLFCGCYIVDVFRFRVLSSSIIWWCISIIPVEVLRQFVPSCSREDWVTLGYLSAYSVAVPVQCLQKYKWLHIIHIFMLLMWIWSICQMEILVPFPLSHPSKISIPIPIRVTVSVHIFVPVPVVT